MKLCENVLCESGITHVFQKWAQYYIINAKETSFYNMLNKKSKPI